MTSSSSPLKLTFITLDVFSSTRYLGNPLAVVFIPASLRPSITQSAKQRIAREFNLSETVFLHTLDDEARNGKSVTSRDIDIFTIEEELPFAGHPTIGSAFLVLNHLGWEHVDTLVTKAGPIGIERVPGGQEGRVRARIPHAVRVHRGTLGGVLEGGALAAEGVERVESALSRDEETRRAELAAPVVSIVKGMAFVLVKLPSLEHLAGVSTAKALDFGVVKGLLDEGEWAESFVARYYYVPGGEPAVGEEGVKEWAIRSRMVELACEDPATGSAACTLASYLAHAEGVKEGKGARFEITQGVEMGRKSDIVVDATVKAVEGGGEGELAIDEIFLGGTAVVVMDGSVLV